jgi:hypothetical protein
VRFSGTAADGAGEASYARDVLAAINLQARPEWASITCSGNAAEIIVRDAVRDQEKEDVDWAKCSLQSGCGRVR